MSGSKMDGTLSAEVDMTPGNSDIPHDPIKFVGRWTAASDEVRTRWRDMNDGKTVLPDSPSDMFKSISRNLHECFQPYNLEELDGLDKGEAIW